MKSQKGLPAASARTKYTGTAQAGNTAIAVSIVAAGALIALALFFVLSPQGGSAAGASASAGGGLEPRDAPSALREVSDDDHIRGNPNASVSVIEFSDFECPFCARLHPTLARLVEENDDVNWVYRHFPLTSIHTRALAAAHASECVAELAGNDAFWDFTDAVFDNQRSLGTSLYEELAGNLGITAEALQSCTKEGRHVDAVRDDLREAQKTGGQGTPYAIVVNDRGEALPFSGALGYDTILQIVDTMR